MADSFLDPRCWSTGESCQADLEVASFERDPLYTTSGRLGPMAETILLPTELALFLLAVRRRFRR